MKKTVISHESGKLFAKSIEMLPADVLGKSLTKTGWKILEMLQKTPRYSLELAQKLKVHEQTVYYHIKLLQNAKLIEVVKTEERNGALCKYYAPTADAFGVELPAKGSVINLDSSHVNAKILEFFNNFISDGFFNGSIVVGSPVDHGPYLTAARDGHYAIHLGVFLGSFCSVSNRFIVKLDTEAKAENATARNMIVVGGPVTNMVSSEINPHMKIQFKWENGWSIISTKTKKEYNGDHEGVIAKLKNPWDKEKTIILIAGLKFDGTKSCVIALTQFYKEVLKNFDKNKDFYCIVRGQDLDGDGKVDSVKVLESFVD